MPHARPTIKFTGNVNHYPSRLWAVYTRERDSGAWQLREQSDGEVVVTNGYCYWSQFNDTVIVKRNGPRDLDLIIRSR